jgi:hypothetical protein
MQTAFAVLYGHLWPSDYAHFSTLPHYSTVFGEIKLLNTNYVLMFLQHLPEALLVIKGVQPHTITNVHRSLCKVAVNFVSLN